MTRHPLDGCPAARYRRRLRGVLTRPEAAHLARLYFERVRSDWPLRYYGLLHYLSHSASDAEFETTMAIVRGIQARIRSAFGPNFVLINDFFSFRSSNHRLFPDLHQDYDFWVFKRRCSGFNLWVLLDHRDMNYSFDVYDAQQNRGLYRRLYGAHAANAAAAYAHGRARSKHQLRHNNSRASSAAAEELVLPHLESIAFRELRERGGVGGVAAKRTNFALEPGDAFILRQPEVHRTDRHAIRPDQWRLALGFKVLERAPLDSARKHFGPVSQDLTQLQVRCPGLMPPIRPGHAWPDVYGSEVLTAYRATSEASGSWIGWLQAASRHLPAETLVMLLVPVAFAVGMLVLARQSERERRR